MERRKYASDVSDEEWGILKDYVPEVQRGGRPAQHARREIVNAIRYVLRSGCSWELLPHDFPPYKTVYDYFRQWRKQGIWEKANQALRERLRQKVGRASQPRAAIIDSQSVKTTEKGGCTAGMLLSV